MPGVQWVPATASTPAIAFNLLIDNLSAFLLTLVSLLSMLIALYSIGYMAHEEGKPRYFAEICLFVAGMLGTVSADNFLQLLVFWEIMGLCSYLLIGFWYHKPEAASAAKKAFLVTRVGDVLFLFGVIAIFNIFGRLDFAGIQEELAANWTAIDPRMLTLIPLLLFGGAVGKSAQFPLHLWLPDAMEGPTPVSALIHAATMVKAGVFLVARSFIFLVPTEPTTHEVIAGAVPWNAILAIAVIGGFTAFFAATMAVVNYDIKRVLAYSTISQLAYMFLGLGAGAWFMAASAPEPETVGYSAGLFHLANHAFFKALLFLAAGSVIHAVHSNDMRDMGGLRKRMPITAWTMLFGCLALAGIPPFSGFWSKDEILSVTFSVGSANAIFYLLWLAGIVTAFLTAFYTFRLWFMTFAGSYRGHDAEHVHESPGVMTGPLAVLSVFAVASGILFLFVLPGTWTNLVFYGKALPESPIAGFTAFPEVALVGASILVAVAGVGLAYLVYYRQTVPASVFTRSRAGAGIHRLLSNRYYLDEGANRLGLYGVMGVARAADWFDRKVIDGAVNGVGRAVLALASASDWFDRKVVDGVVNAFSLSAVRSSFTLRQRQTGRVQNYAAVIVLGMSLVILLIVIVVRVILPHLGG